VDSVISGNKAEHDRPSWIPAPIWNIVLPVMPVIDELALVREIAPVILKQMKRLPIGHVVSDRLVATGKVHVAFLASTEVAKDPEVVPPVVIAQLLAPFGGDDQDNRSFFRGENPGLAKRAGLRT